MTLASNFVNIRQLSSIKIQIRQNTSNYVKKRLVKGVEKSQYGRVNWSQRWQKWRMKSVWRSSFCVNNYQLTSIDVIWHHLTSINASRFQHYKMDTLVQLIYAAKCIGLKMCFTWTMNHRNMKVIRWRENPKTTRISSMEERHHSQK